MARTDSDAEAETEEPTGAKVGWLRRRSAQPLVDAASSVAANVAEGNPRQGKDRLYLFSVAAGSADETRVHLRVAQALGYLEPEQIAASLRLADRQLAVLYRLTH
jgi:four helix bundle protein